LTIVIQVPALPAHRQPPWMSPPTGGDGITETLFALRGEAEVKMRKKEIARRSDPEGFAVVTPSIFIHEVAAGRRSYRQIAVPTSGYARAFLKSASRMLKAQEESVSSDR
jgi:hypothetical protein